MLSGCRVKGGQPAGVAGREHGQIGVQAIALPGALAEQLGTVAAQVLEVAGQSLTTGLRQVGLAGHDAGNGKRIAGIAFAAMR